MFRPRGWSVRIALFIFEWQCAMCNRWWCTKTANPEARKNSLMCWNLKAKSSGARPKVIPHYHYTLSSRGCREGGEGGVDRDTTTQAGQRLGHEDEACAGVPVGGLQLHPYHCKPPIPAHILDFRNPQSVEHAISVKCADICASVCWMTCILMDLLWLVPILDIFLKTKQPVMHA